MKYLGPSYRQNNQPFKIGDIPMGGFVQVEFVKIVDGDTAHFLLDGKEVTVRFLVINTPEMHPIVKPYATEAKIIQIWFYQMLKSYIYNQIKMILFMIIPNLIVFLLGYGLIINY